MATTGCEAILVQYIAFTLTYCGQIAEMATRHRLPSAYEVREYVGADGLISGATQSDAVVAAAETHYGHAGRAFLEKLTRDKRDWQAVQRVHRRWCRRSGEASRVQVRAGGDGRRVGDRVAQPPSGERPARQISLTSYSGQLRPYLAF
jgi:hypothetical protein